MRLKPWCFMWVLLAWGLCGLVHGEALESLSQFLKSTPKAMARFTQTQLPPPKSSNANATPSVTKPKVFKGTLEFIRPQLFRFDYTQPYAQSIVADGHTLWVYDVDLAQVSAKNQSQALANTPAALIARSSDLSELSKGFVLEVEPNRDGLEWVKATPKERDGALQHVRLGLRSVEGGARLVKLEMLDAFDQTSVLTFDDFQLNPPALQSTRFVFKPPPGVEVIHP